MDKSKYTEEIKRLHEQLVCSIIEDWQCLKGTGSDNSILIKLSRDYNMTQQGIRRILVSRGVYK